MGGKLNLYRNTYLIRFSLRMVCSWLRGAWVALLSITAFAGQEMPQNLEFGRATHSGIVTARFKCKDAGAMKMVCSEALLEISHFRERANGVAATPKAICSKHLGSLAESVRPDAIAANRNSYSKTTGSERLVLELQAACLQKDDKATVVAFTAYEDYLAKSCNLYVSTFDATFVPAGDGMWVSDEYGGGCGVHIKRIIRRTGEEWTLEEVNMEMVNKDKLCTDAHGIEGEARRYHKLGFQQEFPVGCEYVFPTMF